MAWITPVYNRTSSSFYNKTDIDRLNNNITYLRDFIETELGYTLTLNTPATIDTRTFGRASLLNTIESNINILKDYLAAVIIGWVDLDEAWVSKTYNFLYTSANNLEVDLELLYITANNIKTFIDYYRCGSSRVICGGGFPIF